MRAGVHRLSCMVDSMKKFFNLYITYSKYVFKFWVNQVTMSVFGVILSAAALETESDILQIGAMLFSIGFLVFLQYDMMFIKGFEDSVRNRESFKPNKWEGLKIGLLSYAPTMLFALLIIIMYLCGAAGAYSILKLIYTFLLHGSYNVFLWYFADVLPDPVLILLTFVPVLVATTLGYYLGLKDMPIRKIFGIPVSPTKPADQKKNKK